MAAAEAATAAAPAAAAAAAPAAAPPAAASVSEEKIVWTLIIDFYIFCKLILHMGVGNSIAICGNETLLVLTADWPHLDYLNLLSSLCPFVLG